jgi:pilus assembly protein CpaB
LSTKKIWLLSLVFGIIAAGLMYKLIVDNQKQAVLEPGVNVNEDNEKETPQVDDKVDVENENEMIPISKGNRAISIAVSDVQGVAGQIKPGSRVDVLVILTVPEEQKESQHDAATLLLQNVKVLAVGHAADDEVTMKRYQMVTIEVTPVEGLTLSFATNYDLHLMLRADGDNEIEPEKTHVHEDSLHVGVFRK